MGDNYPLPLNRAHYFTGPTSDLDREFRTVPSLLRVIADWMDEHDIQDPEFDNLIFKTAFEGGESEDFYETATLYYLESEKKAQTASGD